MKVIFQEKELNRRSIRERERVNFHKKHHESKHNERNHGKRKREKKINVENKKSNNKERKHKMKRIQNFFWSEFVWIETQRLGQKTQDFCKKKKSKNKIENKFIAKIGQNQENKGLFNKKHFLTRINVIFEIFCLKIKRHFFFLKRPKKKFNKRKSRTVISWNALNQ